MSSRGPGQSTPLFAVATYMYWADSIWKRAFNPGKVVYLLSSELWLYCLRRCRSRLTPCKVYQCPYDDSREYGLCEREKRDMSRRSPSAYFEANRKSIPNGDLPPKSRYWVIGAGRINNLPCLITLHEPGYLHLYISRGDILYLQHFT